MKSCLQAFATSTLNEAITSEVIPEQRVTSEEKTTTTTYGAGRRRCLSVRESYPHINKALEELARSKQFSTQNMKNKVEEAVKEVSGERLPSSTSPASWLNRSCKIARFHSRRYEEHYLETIHRYNNSDEQTLLRQLSNLYLKEGRKMKEILQDIANFLLNKAEQFSLPVI